MMTSTEKKQTKNTTQTLFNHCCPKILPDLVSETRTDGKRKYRTPEGLYYPSVTTVIGLKDSNKPELVAWRNRVGPEEANKVSTRATGRGKNLHNIVEKYLKNEKIVPALENPDAFELFKSLRKPLQNINNIQYLEQSLWSDNLKIAGKTDIIADWNDKLSIIDLKSAKKLKKESYIPGYFAQCTMYALMYEERIGIPIEQLVILIAVDNEEPQVFVKKTKDYTDLVLEYLTYYYEHK